MARTDSARPVFAVLMLIAFGGCSSSWPGKTETSGASTSKPQPSKPTPTDPAEVLKEFEEKLARTEQDLLILRNLAKKNQLDFQTECQKRGVDQKTILNALDVSLPISDPRFKPQKHAKDWLDGEFRIEKRVKQKQELESYIEDLKRIEELRKAGETDDPSGPDMRKYDTVRAEADNRPTPDLKAPLDAKAMKETQERLMKQVDDQSNKFAVKRVSEPPPELPKLKTEGLPKEAETLLIRINDTEFTKAMKAAAKVAEHDPEQARLDLAKAAEDAITSINKFRSGSTEWKAKAIEPLTQYIKTTQESVGAPYKATFTDALRVGDWDSALWVLEQLGHRLPTYHDLQEMADDLDTQITAVVDELLAKDLKLRLDELRKKFTNRLQETTSLPTSHRSLSFEGSKPGDIRDDNGLKMKLRWGPPGSFDMGDSSCYDNKQVKVNLTHGGWMGQFEVTQSQWQSLMGTTIRQQGEKHGGFYSRGEGPDHPMYDVDYNEATDFARKFTESERQAGRLPANWEYRLPTEAEWEYFYRAGTTTKFGPFGDELKPTDANFGNPKGGTVPVGQYRPNAWGLCDMAGNVWEWTQDWYDAKLQGGDDPKGPLSGSSRVNRGGSWDYDAERCTAAYRCANASTIAYRSLGFRLLAVPLDQK